MQKYSPFTHFNLIYLYIIHNSLHQIQTDCSLKYDNYMSIIESEYKSLNWMNSYIDPLWSPCISIYLLKNTVVFGSHWQKSNFDTFWSKFVIRDDIVADSFIYSLKHKLMNVQFCWTSFDRVRMKSIKTQLLRTQCVPSISYYSSNCQYALLLGLGIFGNLPLIYSWNTKIYYQIKQHTIIHLNYNIISH